MAKMYYDNDVDLAALDGRRIAILGYGNQGRPHALNLKESGCEVVVGLREGSSSWSEAEAEGLKVMTVEDATAAGNIVMMLIPDQVQREVYYASVERGLKAGKTLMFAHGFNIHFNQVIPPKDVDVSMVAPKAPGNMMRQVFQEGAGVPALFAVHQDATGRAKETALAYAKGLGSTKAGVLETTFAEETETDLFGEQAVLCGGVTALIKAGFEVLVEAGYQPELAYFECLHELKLIVDLIYRGGLGHMRRSVSDTAEYGDYVSGPRVITEETKDEMREMLREVQNGEFARRWILENQAGRPSFNAMRRREAEHPIEEVGKKLRATMKWLQEKGS